MNIKSIGPGMGNASKPSKLQQFYIDTADSIIRRHEISSTKARTPAEDVESIVIVCVSDTHNLQPDLPDGDVLIHAGDLSQKGTFDELQSQLDWLQSQPHPHKIAIAGNHDLLLDDDFCSRFPHKDPSKPGKSRTDLVWGSISYLQNSACQIEVKGRRLKIWGCPLTPEFGNWAFQYPPIRDSWSNMVPDDADIVISHGPPKLHLDDSGKGDEYLLHEIRRVKPRLCIFGHIHPGHGRSELWHGEKALQGAWEEVKLRRGGALTIAGMYARSVFPRNDSLQLSHTILINAAIKQRGKPADPQIVRM